MLADDNSEVREKAVNVIIKLRNSSENPDKGNTSVRKLYVQNLKYDCKSNCDTTDFKNQIMYEPHITLS